MSGRRWTWHSVGRTRTALLQATRPRLQTHDSRLKTQDSSLPGYLAAILLTSAATAGLYGLNHVWHVPTIALLYVPVILLVAIYYGTWPSLLAATLAALEYDFFFLQPLYTFTIDRAEDIEAFAIFGIVALATGQLAARSRERAEAAHRREMETMTLYERGRVLEESDRLKTGLLNAVSHDLRTPLTSIKASVSELLLGAHGSGETNGSEPAPERQELLETIDHEADRLNRLVGNLLDLSRIEAGALRPVLEWYDIQEVVAALRTRLAPIAGDRPLAIEVADGIPPVQIDLLRIEELVINLVENALKYTPAGSPLAVRIERHDGALRIAVADHGPGVPDALRGKIFEAFYQGRQHGDRRPGAGLGLAISQGIAQAHGGSLAVEETPGGGATFVLTLPHALGDRRVPA